MISDTGLAGRTHGALHRQHRAARRQRAGQPGRPRPSGRSATSQATEKVRAALRDALPGHAGLLLHRRHREAHPELRLARRRSTSRSSATTSNDGASYAKQLAAKLRGARGREGPAAAHRRADLARGELPASSTWSSTARRRACSGVSEQQVAQTVLTSLRRATRSSRPSRSPTRKTGNEYFINVRIDDRFRTARRAISATCSLRSPPGGDGLARHAGARSSASSGPVSIDRKYLQRIIDVTANVAPGQGPRRGAAPPRRASLDETPAARRLHRRSSAARPPAQKAGLPGPRLRGAHGARARLHGARVAVQVAGRPAGHHVQRAAGHLRRLPDAVCLGHHALGEQLHGHHHDGRHRRVQRRAARRLRQRAAPARHAAHRGHGRGRAHAPAADPDDDHRHRARPRADGARHRRGQRDQPAAGARGHRRPHRVHVLHAVLGPGALHACSTASPSEPPSTTKTRRPPLPSRRMRDEIEPHATPSWRRALAVSGALQD